jgi:hypothetical protein
MSESSRVHTIRLPLSKFCSALPAVALVGAGIMLPASANPIAASHLGLASESSPAVVVPDTPMTLPGSQQSMDDPQPERSQRAPATMPLASILPAGTDPGSSSPVTLDSAGIPVRALEGYRKAAALISSADPACHLDWPLVAAIGRVESDHGRDNGNQLDAAGTAQPGIIGIPLDGSNGTARITDTDHGRLDRDTVYDRAVGPMQFIPSTWQFAGVDANGDGVKDPQNIADAATATAVYLCSGSGDLQRPSDLRSAILRYNPSDSYVSMVIAIADAYRHGVTALPASDVAPAVPATAASRTTAAAAKHTRVVSAKPAAHRPGATPARTTAPRPGLTPRPLPTPVPAVTQVPGKTPGVPQPAEPTPATTQPGQPTPTTTCVPIPSPTSTGTPTDTPSGTASPTPTQTCLPPCAATASPTSTGTPTATPSGTASPTPAQTCLPPCVATTASNGTTGTASAQPCVTPTSSTTSSSKATP